MLLLGSVAYLRFSFVDRQSFAIGAPVAALSLLAASIPFISSGHLGVPGIGVNNDMAAHLIFADWLQNPTGPVPGGIEFGYPIGPHGMVATVSEALGTQPLYGFLGLLLAITVITALTSLNLLAELPPVKRTIAAVLVSVPYLAASTFGIGGFKEMMVGLFLVAFALILRELPRAEKGQLALIGALAALAAGSIAAYSYPGLAWLAGTAGIWALAELVLAYRHGRMDEVRAGVRRAAPLLLIGLLILAVLAVAELPRIKGFIDEGAPSTLLETDSKLRFPVPAPEAFGVWPSGEWLFGYGEFGLDAWQLFALVGLVAFGFAAWWWLRRGDVALPAAVAASAILYLWTLSGAGLYVEAKSLQVPAVLIMLFILGALLLPSVRRRRGAPPSEQEPGPGPPGSARQGIGLRALIAVPFMILAAYSSFLALRDAVIAPSDRFDELEAFRGDRRQAGAGPDQRPLLRLLPARRRGPQPGQERRGQVRGPPGQGLPAAGRLRLGLRQRHGPVRLRRHHRRRLPERRAAQLGGGRPHRLIRALEAPRPDPVRRRARRGGPARPRVRCKLEKFKRILERQGTRRHLAAPCDREAPQLGGRGGAARRRAGSGGERRGRDRPGESATQTITLPQGSWDLSFQYASEVVPLEVQVGDDTFEMPPGIEGAIPFRPDEGPYWPVGTVESDGGPSRSRSRPGSPRRCSGRWGSTPPPRSATSPPRASRKSRSARSRTPATATWTTTTSAPPGPFRSRRRRAPSRPT